MTRLRLALLAAVPLTLLASLAACQPKAEAPASGTAAKIALPEVQVTDAELAGNPFLGEWNTPFGTPPFAEITDAHYRPAFLKGILEARADIAAIRDNPEAPTFANTILAMERTGELLDRVSGTFGNVTNTDTNDTLRALETEIYPMLTRERDATLFDEALFARVKAVYDQRATLGLNEEDARLLELTHKRFVRAGAELSPEKRAELGRINAELSGLSTQFNQNQQRANNAFKLVITDPADLAGLSETFKTAIKTPDKDEWVVGISRSPFETFMTQSTNRELRRQLFDGYRLQASSGEFDNGPVILKIAQLRAQRAELLGYRSHADYVLYDTMAKTPQEAEAFLLRVWRPGLERAKEELADIQALMGREGITDTAGGHDWWHYSERVRQERYAFDDAALAPYFELNATRLGAFDVAGKLFGVTFTPVETPEWNPVVESFEVKGADGQFLGLFMMDMTARASKRGGAWMSTYRDAEKVDGQWTRPIVTNNLNLTPAPAGEPQLMRFDEVETLYHEFGHGLHGLMTQVSHPTFSGVDGPRDYTEFPAQILEHWASQPQVLQAHARHYQTGEGIPMELIERMRTASTFNQGFKTTEFIAASLLDLRWHTLTAAEAAAITDVRAFEQKVLAEYGLIDQIEPRYRSQYFNHIFGGGYSAGYYSYLWSEILDADGFEAFKETGDIFNPEVAARLKTWVYEAGGLRPADELYRLFRGKDPDIAPLLRGRGFGETEG